MIIDPTKPRDDSASGLMTIGRACSDGEPRWKEPDRLAELGRYGILDTPREPQFDDVVRLAADIFEAPIAVINLIAEGRQWFKAEIGIGADELPLDVSICAHAILQPGIFVVPDTTQDERFANNPLVTGEPGLRFYAGALLETPKGLPLGTVCVLDTKPRPYGITERQRLTLEVLAHQVMTQLELRRAVTEREHRAEARVAERTAELQLARDIIEANTSPICAFDTQYRLIAFNRAHSDEFFRIFDHRVALGEVFPDLFPADQAPTIRAFMARALAGESYTVVEEFGDPKLVKPYWEVSYTPLRNQDGQVVGAFHLAKDITVWLRAQAELEHARDALRQSQKMEAMGQLTGGVAHDFNNLLTPIIGSLDMLVRRGLGSERERRLIDGALQSAERAKTLVQRLLAFARRQPLQPLPVDLRQLVADMADLISSTSGPDIDVHVDLPEDLPSAMADANQVEMAVLNLAVNARDAMPDGGLLTISAARAHVGTEDHSTLSPGDYVRLSVTDTGVGMGEATLARAIEPFFSTKDIGKGTGLGLSMVHGLALQLNGGLTIQSKSGEGTSIELWLPVSTAAVAADNRTPDRPPTSKGLGTVLLVDDEELVRLSTAYMLIDLGYEVAEASSAEEALRLLDAGLSPDLLVTDHLMPGMNGAELARHVSSQRPGLPVLIVSGYAEAEGIAPGLARLTKPFRNAELASSLAALSATNKA